MAKDATFAVTHPYAKPGSYTVMVEPKRTGVTLKCLGENARATLSVTAPAPKAAAAATAAAAPGKTPNCPEGWTLDAKSVKNKTGAFRCTAKPSVQQRHYQPASHQLGVLYLKLAFVEKRHVGMAVKIISQRYQGYGTG